jgi:hypothetical protein
MASSINAVTTGGGGVVTTADSSGILEFQVDGTPVIEVTAGGLVGNLIGNADTATAFTTASGSAPSYAVRAWVKFDGTVSAPINNGSGNVASITDPGVGSYTIDFIDSMQSAGYSVSGAVNGWSAFGTQNGAFSVGVSSMSSGSVSIVVISTNGAASTTTFSTKDASIVTLMIVE